MGAEISNLESGDGLSQSPARAPMTPTASKPIHNRRQLIKEKPYKNMSRSFAGKDKPQKRVNKHRQLQPQLISAPDNFSGFSGDSDPDPDTDQNSSNGKVVTIFKKYQNNTQTPQSQQRHARHDMKPQIKKLYKDEKYLANNTKSMSKRNQTVPRVNQDEYTTEEESFVPNKTPNIQLAQNKIKSQPFKRSQKRQMSINFSGTQKLNPANTGQLKDQIKSPNRKMMPRNEEIENPILNYRRNTVFACQPTTKEHSKETKQFSKQSKRTNSNVKSTKLKQLKQKKLPKVATEGKKNLTLHTMLQSNIKSKMSVSPKVEKNLRHSISLFPLKNKSTQQVGSQGRLIYNRSEGFHSLQRRNIQTVQVMNKKSQSSISEESFAHSTTTKQNVKLSGEKQPKRGIMIKLKPAIPGGNSLSFNDKTNVQNIAFNQNERNNTIGEENLENADDLNCIPSFNLKLYGTMISNQPPKKMIKEIDILKPNDAMDETEILQILPLNGCNCDKSNEITYNRNPKGCSKAQQWLHHSKIDQDNFVKNYQRYRMYLNFKQSENKLFQIIEDIEMDLERTFIEIGYFRRTESKQALKRILLAFSNYDKQLGYVQGMNYISGVLLFHCGEVHAFWLLCTIMSQFRLNQVLRPGFPGLSIHNERLEKRIKNHLPKLHSHLQAIDLSVNLFSTEWVMSIFLSIIPIQFTSLYLDAFFKAGWEVFYRVAVEVLRYMQLNLMLSQDPGDVLGQIKQAKKGCEHLLAIHLQSTQASLKTNSLRKKQTISLPEQTQKRQRSRINHINISGQPINQSTKKQKMHNPFEQPENFKEDSILEDSTPDGPQNITIKQRFSNESPQKKVNFLEIMSDEILDEQSSDFDEILINKNDQMWIKVLNQLKQLDI